MSKEEQMKYGSLILEKKDFLVIQKYQELNLVVEDYSHKNILEILEKNMSKAMLFNAEEIPSDIIQMYSFITVTGASRWRKIFQLVAPCEVDVKKNKISVISSLGASVIGLSEGDTIQYGLPGSVISLKIEKVEQRRKRILFDISEEVLN